MILLNVFFFSKILFKFISKCYNWNVEDVNDIINDLKTDYFMGISSIIYLVDSNKKKTNYVFYSYNNIQI